MKIIVFVAILVVYSCKTTNENSLKVNNPVTRTECPDDGKCSFSINHNKSFNLINDELGQLFPNFSDDNSKVLLSFEYERNEIPNTADNHYKEIVHFQLNKNHLELDLKDENLEKVKLTFARLCFCKGATGYYFINNGQLSIKKIDAKTYQLNLNFKTKEVPQIVEEISEKFIYNDQ